MTVPTNVSILALLSSELLSARLKEALDTQRYSIATHVSARDFLAAMEPGLGRVDCLVIDALAIEALAIAHQPSLFATLHQANILLPAVILHEAALPHGPALPAEPAGEASAGIGYHQAEVGLPWGEVAQLGDRIDLAIKQFLQLSPSEIIPDRANAARASDDPSPAALLEQQQRLARKLKERLGYLGVYYKRSPENFYRSLNDADQQQLLSELTAKYQAILLSYFSETAQINGLIDEFVNLSFFSDISVTQIVEIHMKLIDEYAKQLKLEGRNEAVLVNYRLALLDIISHLCEMYRRSIPRQS